MTNNLNGELNLSVGPDFEAGLRQLRSAGESWIDVAAALRRLTSNPDFPWRPDQVAIFERWASRRMGHNEGLLRRYSVVLEFLVRKRVLPDQTTSSTIPAGLRRKFSVLELAARIEKFSEVDGDAALRQALSGEASVSSLTKQLRQISSTTQIDTTVLRRSRAAASRADRDTILMARVDMVVRERFGPEASLRSLGTGSLSTSRHFIIDGGHSQGLRLAVANVRGKNLREAETPLAVALFALAPFDVGVIVLIGNDGHVQLARQMISYSRNATSVEIMHVSESEIDFS